MRLLSDCLRKKSFLKNDHYNNVSVLSKLLRTYYWIFYHNPSSLISVNICILQQRYNIDKIWRYFYNFSFKILISSLSYFSLKKKIIISLKDVFVTLMKLVGAVQRVLKKNSLMSDYFQSFVICFFFSFKICSYFCIRHEKSYVFSKKENKFSVISLT